jgi:isopentenyl phosphate kinase
VRIEIRQKATTQKRAKKRLRDVTHQLQNMHQNREKIIIVHNVFSFFSSSASSAGREPHIASSDSRVFQLHRSSVTRLFNSFPIIFSSISSES